MSTPRVVVVHRRSEYDELLRRHGTRGQAAFFLSTRGQSLAAVEDADKRWRRAIDVVLAALPPDWRRGTVERQELARFLFEPGDLVVVVGQDGLVANVAKYLDGQPVLGVDPGTEGNLGVLTRHSLRDGVGLLPHLGDLPTECRTMVEATLDDGQSLVALNEVYVGHASHQTSRYLLVGPEGKERQASSGLIVSTGTGATGWCRSAWLERHSALRLPGPAEDALAFFVREAWPSPVTGSTYTEGLLGGSDTLSIEAESDLVVFGDGIEQDRLTMKWGQSLAVGTSGRVLRLV